jgi:YfiH family protein
MTDDITIFGQHPNVIAKLWPSKPSGEDVRATGANELVVLHQVHGNDVHELEPDNQPPDGDGLYTDKSGYLLAMRVADCVAVLIYDPEHQAVAAVHSGWRGTRAEIVPEMITRLKQKFDSDPAKLLAYLSPAGQSCCYEVGPEFKEYFDDKYFEERDGKLYFDNSGLVYAQLNENGVAHENIQWDERCTIHNTDFPSYRRDKTSDRMFVAIGLSLSSRP